MFSHRRCRRTRLLSPAILLPALLPQISFAFGASETWTAGSGNWSTTTNWSTNSLPAGADTASISPSDGVDRTVTYNYTGPAVTLSNLTVNLTGAAGNSTTTFSMAANTLSSNNESIGYSGNATNGIGAFNQAGGSNNVSTLYLGRNASDTGAYSLSGFATLSVATTEYIANNGTATMTQSAGNNNLTNSASGAIALAIGYATNSNGTYLLNGGSINSQGDEYVGYNGTANFSQSSGSNAFNGHTLYLAYTANSTASYFLSSGSCFGSALYVGYNGSGTLTQSGGSASFADLTLSSSGHGTDNLSGNATLPASSDSFVGLNGPAIFNQSGGQFSTSNILYIGFSQPGVSDFNLSAGNLSAHSEIVGLFGNGVVTQTGGASFPFDLSLGYDQSGNGTYSLSGNGTITAQNEHIGINGVGNFIQSGGVNTVNSGLDVGPNGAATPGTGAYTLSDSGTLTVATSETIGAQGTGTFNQSGGTNTTPNVYIAGTAGVVCSYSLSGNGTLNTHGLVVGQSGTGTFAQTGGSSVITGPSPSATLLLIGSNAGANGNYSLGGTGVLSVSGNEFVGYAGNGTL